MSSGRSRLSAFYALILAVLILPGCAADRAVLVGSPPEAPPLADDGKWRPFGPYARLPDPSGAAAPGPSTIITGTGAFVDPPRGPKGERRDPDDRTFTLNLVETSVAEAAKVVLGDIFRLNYTVDSKIDSRITVQTSQPVTRRGIGELFEASLRTIGAVVVQNGNVYRVVTADQSAMGAKIGLGGAASPNLIGNSVKIVPLQYVAPSEMKRILDPLANFGGVVRADESRNVLVLSGTEQDIAAMEEAISVFDVDVMKGMSFAVVPVIAVDPELIIDDLNKIFSANRDGPMNGMVQFIANKKLKSILVIAKQPRYVLDAQRWVRRLDARAVGTQRQFHTYALRNRQSKEVVDVLHSVFSRETGASDQGQARADVAPRFRRAGVETPSATTTTQTTATGAQPGLVSQSFSVLGGTATRADSGFETRDRTGPRTEEASPSPSTATEFGANAGDEPRIKIVADPANNSLLILATHEDYKRVERVIANLDVVPNQVLIEATICEVTLTDDLKFGVRWFFQGEKGKSTSLFTAAVDGALGAVFPGFSYVFKTATNQVTLNALNDVTRVNVLASPSLMVLDNKTATLQIGDQVPITTQTAVSVLTPGAPIVNSVAYKDTGVILSVTPRINEAGRVLLEIEQEVSTVSRTLSSNIDSPTIGRRRVKTTVIVNDGEGITLGGLIQDRETNKAQQIPILGNIPFIGSAFRDKGDTSEKTELIILLTPRVVRDLNEARAVTQEYRRKVDLFTPRKRHPAKQFEHDVNRTFQ